MHMNVWSAKLVLLVARAAWSADFIVEVASLEHVTGLAHDLRLQAFHCLQAYAQVSVRRQYTSSIFQGVSVAVTATNRQQVDSVQLDKCLRSLSGVVATWALDPYIVATVPTTFRRSNQQGDDSVPVETSSQPGNGINGETVEIVNSRRFHGLTGVQSLHDRNITGTGVTIAIIDEGIDYLHPAFSGGFVANYTVQYGLDLVGDDFDADTAPLQDTSPYSECTFHGTHVTGIAVGRQESVGFVGVAPDARIEFYRILGCGDGAPIRADVVVDAILAAHARGVDVISMSLDSRTGPYSDDVVSEVLERVVRDDKIVCVVSAGNHGAQGPFSITSPASAVGVLSVGSVNTESQVKSIPRARYAIDTGDAGGHESWVDFSWLPGSPSRFPNRLPLHALSLNSSVQSDACKPLPTDIDLGRVMVLVRRGGCVFKQKMANLITHGAEYVLLYDNYTDATDPFTFSNTFPGIKGVGSVTAQMGETFVRALAAGQNIFMDMDSDFTLPPYIRQRPNANAPGMASGRGSWGPSGSLGLVPSLLAPGWGIWGPVPRSWGGYRVFSGTSMSAPYAAGCVALLRQANPALSATSIVRRLVSTAQPLHFSAGLNETYDFLASAWQQGGGRINALAAVETQTDLSVSSLPFNDTEYFDGHAAFVITNCGVAAATYKLQSTSSVTISTFAASDNNSVIPWTVQPSSNSADPSFLNGLLPASTSANISLLPSSLVLAPGASAIINVTATIDNLMLEERRCPLYSGFIAISSDRNETLTLPYGGVGCRMSHIAPLPSGGNRTFLTGATFSDVESSEFDSKPGPSNTAFELPQPGSPAPDLNSPTVYPTVVLQLAMFSPRVVVSVEAFEGTGCGSGGCAIASYPARENTGRPGGYARSTVSHLLWRGELKNGSWVAAGSYRFKVCAVRAWGKGEDCLDTEPFAVRYV